MSARCPAAGEIAEALVRACPAARVTMRERVVRGSYRTVVRAALAVEVSTSPHGYLERSHVPVADATSEADHLRDMRYRWSPWVQGC